MFTKNFLYWTSTNTLSTSIFKTFANTSQNAGNVGGLLTNYNHNTSSYYANATAGSYVDVGFGNTPPTSDDYKLEDSNACDTPTLTFISNGYPSINTYPYVRNVTTTYANNSGSDVTIKEIGLVSKSGTANSKQNNMLITRTVLDTPIVVPNGSQIAVTVSLEI